MPETEPFLTHRITLEDVSRAYPPKQLINYEPPKYNGEVLCVARAVYEAVPQKAADNRLRMLLSLGRDYAPGNLWLPVTYERLVYPYAVYWPLANAFAAEKEQGRRFDWLVWLDDDVMVSADDIRTLLKVAKEKDLRFIAATPYDRMPPHTPSVIEMVDGQPMKWVKAPKSGSYPVGMVGFVLCLFHRSVFDIVPEPWFGVCGPWKGFAGIALDWWWCLQMQKAGLQPWVCCDTDVIHLGHKQEIGRAYAETYFDQVGLPDMPGVPQQTSVSPQTGAVVTLPPQYSDGRADFVEETHDGKKLV